MAKQRHLSDLFQVGKMITLDDGRGEEVKIWLQKMTPVDQETATRRAGAKRAAVLALARDSESSQEDRGIYTNQLFDFAKDREDVIQFLANEEVSEHVAAYEAEIAAEEEWSKDNYYQGLVDAWRELYAREFAESEEVSEEAQRVSDELERFQKQLEKRIVREQEAAAKDFADLSDKKLIDMATNKMIETRAGIEWLKEYRACEVWLGCRDPKNKSKKYFSSRSEVDELQFETLATLIEEYQKLNVEVTEGKDLEEVQAS